MKTSYLLVLIFILSSCLKRNETLINQTCIDSCMTFNVQVRRGEKSSTPVENADVELSWSSPGNSSPFGDPGRLIGSGKTNKLGTIKFSFKALRKELNGGRYSVDIKNNSDGFQPYINYFLITRFDSTVNANLHLPTKAFLKIIYKNFRPQNNEGFFQASPFYKNYGTSNLNIKLSNINGGLPNTSFFGNEGFDKVELAGITAGNQYTYFNIIRRKNGVRKDLLDSIYLSTGETKTYEIEY